MSDSAPPGIFISYRREDASGHAGRLHDHLVAHFGAERIFMDVESIEAGRDFAAVLDEALAGCQALVAVIGPRWLTATDDGGRRRLDADADFVRLELETAITGGRRVVPVLVQGASMPAAADLPGSLEALSRFQAFELSDRHWRADVGSLLGLLDRICLRAPASREANAPDTIPFPAALTTAGKIATDIAPGTAPALPFVGRQAEQDALAVALSKAEGGTRSMVVLLGEPGIGKTRLVTEAAGAAHAQGALVLYGRCDEDLGVPYQPFVEALRYFVDHAPYELAPRLGDSRGELARLVPELGEHVPDLPPPLQADPETERYHLFDAVVTWLATTSRDHPVVLVLDDIQWATQPTLLLVRHLARSPEPMRVLVLATCRSTELGRALTDLLADLRRVAGVEQLTLAGLDETDVGALVEAALGPAGDGDGRAVTGAIQAKTEGHPLFVTEVLNDLVGMGGRSEDSVGGTPPELGIPEGVRDVIGRRVGALSQSGQRVLGIGSVIGQSFDVDVLEAVVPDEGDDVLDALDEATAAQLVNETADGGFRFSHGLIRETVAGRIGATRATRLHRQIGEAIERLRAPRLDEHLPALAHHFARAASTGAADRAAYYALLAARRAVEGLAFEEAVDYLQQGLASIDIGGGAETGELEACRREIVLELADLRELRGEYPDADDLYSSLLGHNDVRAVRGLAAVLRKQGEYSMALSVLDDAIGSGRYAPETLGVLWLERGRNLLVAATMIDAIAAFEAGLAVAPPGEPVAGDLLLQLALAESSVDRADVALEHAREGRRIFEERGHQRGLTIAWRVLGAIYVTMGRLDDAVHALGEGLALAERIGNVEERGACLINLGLVKLSQGALDEAIECDRRAIEQFERIGHPARANGYANLAEKLMEHGDHDDALRYSRDAVDAARANNDLITIADATLTAAKVHLRQSHPEQAATEAEEAAELFEQTGVTTYAVDALEVAAEAWARSGDTDRAAAAGRRSNNMKEATG